VRGAAGTTSFVSIRDIFLMDPPMSSAMTIMHTINENRAPLGLATWSYVYRLKPL
jgi:hypothetical protein